MASLAQPQPPLLALVTGFLFLGAFLLYRWLLPKPIPGIPYNAKAIKSIFGDIPDLLEHLKHSEQVTDWMEGHNLRHNSPIAQVFLNLFQKPVVMINDFKESQDILMRRGKEFDKPDMISDLLYGIAREHHTTLKSNDERFKLQRKWLQDLMSPSFLHGVAGPHLHKTFMELMALWQVKMRLSGMEHSPFPIKPDLSHSALEAIWAALFGTGETATITQQQIDLLSPLNSQSVKTLQIGTLDLPEASRAPAFDAILRLTDTFEGVTKSPFPRIYGWFLPFRFSHLVKLKDDLIIGEIHKAERRLHDVNGEQGKVFNAIDHMLHREAQQAARDHRKPEFYSKPMIAEIFGLLIAGHDTTASTIMWTMKRLAGHPDVQSKLRDELRKSYTAALTEGRVPSAHEIVNTTIHYLDACIEEMVRCAQTAPVTSRTASKDAVVLGHVIPKGTRIIMMGRSAGILKPSHNIPDSLRSPTFHNAGGGKIGAWDESSPEDLLAFHPERWLKTEADGSRVFDATLGPHLGFGAGPRGCFGRKLAYLELRLAIVLVLWHFELQRVPEHLDSYEPIEQLTHNPLQCYVKLAPAPSRH